MSLYIGKRNHPAAFPVAILVMVAVVVAEWGYVLH